MVASWSSPSITVIRPNSTPCWSPIGSPTPHPTCLPRTSACRWTRSRYSPAQQVDLPDEHPAPPLAVVEAQMAAAAGNPPDPVRVQARRCGASRETKRALFGLLIAPTSSFQRPLPRRWSRSSRAGCATCIGIPMPMNGCTFIKGTGRTIRFNTRPPAITANFHSGDIGYVKKALGHYVENTGNTEPRVHGSASAPTGSRRVSLSDWLAHSPIDMVAETLNLDPTVIAQFPKNRPDIVPV